MTHSSLAAMLPVAAQTVEILGRVVSLAFAIRQGHIIKHATANRVINHLILTGSPISFSETFCMSRHQKYSAVYGRIFLMPGSICARVEFLDGLPLGFPLASRTCFRASCAECVLLCLPSVSL